MAKGTARASTIGRNYGDGLTALRRNLPVDIQERLKAIACHLFATKGVDGVNIREILSIAKIRNAGAIGYYFGSKENLVRQILIDGTKILEKRRGFLLDNILEQNTTIAIKDLINVLVQAVVEEKDLERQRFIGFSLMVSLTHRDLYITAMFEQPHRNFSRCMKLLRKMMPVMPETAANQRLMFLKSNLAVALARREGARNGVSDSNEWAFDHTLAHFVESETAMLSAPFSPFPSWPEIPEEQVRDYSHITLDPL